MFSSILVGTDGSQRAEKAVQEAIDLAKSEGARLHIAAAFGEHASHWESIQTSRDVQVIDLRSVAEQIVARLGGQAAEQGVKEVDWSAREGDPAEVILDVASSENADVIVVGNKGMTGRKRFLLGSVPNKIVHHAPCSVMIVNTD